MFRLVALKTLNCFLTVWKYPLHDISTAAEISLAVIVYYWFANILLTIDCTAYVL
jgi:hypothetical protein